MPYSSEEGKGVIRQWVRNIQPRTVLDVGAGSGTYARLVREYAPGVVVDGVEIFQPYVSTFDLTHLYDRLIVGDIRTCDIPRESYDLVIMGDVLEHMSFTDAERVWSNMLLLSTRACILSIPVVPYPQGPENGNVHEAHVSTWSGPDVYKRLLGITDWCIGSKIGVFCAVTEPLPVGIWETS